MGISIFKLVMRYILSFKYLIKTVPQITNYIPQHGPFDIIAALLVPVNEVLTVTQRLSATEFTGVML